MKSGYVYILASQRNGTLYIGVTSDLLGRIYQHKNDLVEGFTAKYRVHILVYYETHDRIEDAIAREKALKNRGRRWKLRLIEDFNPDWRDLYADISGF
jgi:putative endonuclease